MPALFDCGLQTYLQRFGFGQVEHLDDLVDVLRWALTIALDDPLAKAAVAQAEQRGHLLLGDALAAHVCAQQGAVGNGLWQDVDGATEDDGHAARTHLQLLDFLDFAGQFFFLGLL